MYKGIKVLAGNLAFVSRNEHHPFRNGTKIIAITFQLVKDEARDAHSVHFDKTMRQVGKEYITLEARELSSLVSKAQV